MNKIKLDLKKILKIPSKIEVKLINIYQRYISSGLGHHCKFYPTYIGVI